MRGEGCWRLPNQVLIGRRWADDLRPMMTIVADPATSWPHRLPEMFHMD